MIDVLPSLEQLLPADFRADFDLNEASQYGLVVADLDANIRSIKRRQELKFFRFPTSPPNWQEQGLVKKCSMRVAMAYQGDTQYELISNVQGSNFYQGDSDDYLHHVGVTQNNSDEVAAKLNAAGFTTVVEGGVKLGGLFGFRFKYIDTLAELGVYLELLDFYCLNRQVDIKPLVSSLAY